jgi:uncharacterized protein (DUF4415 family)
MNEKNLNNQSETDWTRLEAMTDEDIDTSDIAPLDESFFANATLRMPKDKISVVVNIDPETNEWYVAQGAESKDLMTAALRIYAEAHKEIHR